MVNTEKRKYQNNIILDYLHMFFRNVNFTHGIWILFLISRGSTYIEVGILEMIFHISSLVMEVPTGVIGDLYGRRTSRLLGILSYFIYIGIILMTNNMFFLVIAFIICGMSYTFESGSSDAMVYDSLKEIGKENSFMKVNGIKEVIYQTASVLVLLLTGWLLSDKFQLNYILTIIMFLIAFFIIFLMKETKLPHNLAGLKFKQRMNEHFVKTWKVITSSKRLTLLIIIGALLLAPVTSLFIWAQDYFTTNGYSNAWMLYFLAIHSIASAIGGFMASWIERKFGERRMLIVIPMLLAVCFWLTLSAKIGFVGFIVVGFLESIFYVVLIDYINRMIPSETRASVLSFLGMSFSMVMIFIFPVMGLIGQLSKLWFGYLFVAIIVTIVVIILLFVIKNNHLNQDLKKIDD